MVLLHGITNSCRTWLPVLPALESEHDVLALTLAGHYGAAPLPAGVTASVSALTDAAERALDEAGFDAAHLVGNSLGGWVAFELAKRGRAASVVAFSPAGGRPRTSPEEARRVARKIDLGFRLARVLSPVAGPLTRFPIGRRALFSQLAAHPERIPPQEAAYRLRALAGCAVLPGLLASIVPRQPSAWTRSAVPCCWSGRPAIACSQRRSSPRVCCPPCQKRSCSSRPTSATCRCTTIPT